MAGRRFAPLIVCVLLGTLVIALRLFQVQVLERGTWAAEAASMVRAGDVRPYRRGSILDAQGRELAHDERGYRVELAYRDFRRGNPLGQVAHARSALLAQPIALADALAHLSEWAGELVSLTPAQLEGFARGEALEHGSMRIAGTDAPEAEERVSRRSDVRFYATALFALERAELRALLKSLREAPDERLLDLAARAAKRDASQLAAELAERLAACGRDLAELEQRIEADDPAASAQADDALERIVARLEAWRREVEDDSATGLFREAVDFSPGRIEPGVLARWVDLDWIAAHMRWDGARLAEWLARARADWLDGLQRGSAERWLVELELGENEGALSQRALARWKQPFVANDGTALLVLDELESLFAGVESAPSAEPRLSFEDARADASKLTPDDEARWLACLELGWDADSAEVEALAAGWRAATTDDFDAAFVRARTLSVLARWEADFQAALAAGLERAALEAAGDGELELLRLAPARLERTAERARYVLKDRGSRPALVLRRPSYPTVHFLTRHPERFRGFRVVEATERVVARDAEGNRVAGALLGSVSAPSWREQLLEADLRREFERLRDLGARDTDQQRELEWLAARAARPDEERGAGGIESYCDRELAGQNGYREQRGMQEFLDGRAALDIAPRDGADVKLTLDLDLQLAARAALADPEGDPEATLRDYEWLARPTGAIVLLTPGGDVLAAASYPDFARGDVEPRSARDQPYERTLRKPTFQPPGSVFKPFVAAWALDHAALDPSHVESCVLVPELEMAGYLDVRCNTTYGHGAVDLADALARSCNSYFARLGERIAPGDWRALAHEFGFGEPTGVRGFGARRGLLEDVVPSLFTRELEGRDLRLAGNGLAIVEATPMQVARAFAALATGHLPELRLIESAGDTVTERRSRPLTISNASLERVRAALCACASSPGGSAEPALNAREIGYAMAAKTGSGDIGSRKQIAADGKQRVRKHTWLAGWLPADEPRLVVVVFLHDTVQTASHSAIWVARELLQSPAVQRYLAAGESK